MGIVLPESVFDTTENKYIRLFLYKYFKIKAVISLPQISFEPYTSTKTSILFAQKKTSEEIEKWEDSWSEHSKVYSKLKTRINDYLKYFIEGKSLNKKWATDVVEDLQEYEKTGESKNIINNIILFLKHYIKESDKTLNIKDLLEKYYEEIEEILKYDKDLIEEFGYVNTRWVFAEVAKDLGYDIFMAEVENVGYKRTKRGENPMPNELFDIEIAPDQISFNDIEKRIDEDIKYLQNKLKTENDKKEPNHNKVEKLEIEIKNLENEKENIISVLYDFYNEEGKLKDKDRWYHIDKFKEVFKSKYLTPFKSSDILLREDNQLVLLDYIREGVQWD